MNDTRTLHMFDAPPAEDAFIGRTLHQPYAGLVAAELKTIETRKSRIHHRGPLVICASLTPDREAWARLRPRIPEWAMPLCEIRGQAISLHDVTGCRVLVPDDEPLSWFYAPDRFAWLLANRRLLRPFEQRGYQGFFKVHGPTLRAAIL